MAAQAVCQEFLAFEIGCCNRRTIRFLLNGDASRSGQQNGLPSLVDQLHRDFEQFRIHILPSNPTANQGGDKLIMVNLRALVMVFFL